MLNGNIHVERHFQPADALPGLLTPKYVFDRVSTPNSTAEFTALPDLLAGFEGPPRREWIGKAKGEGGKKGKGQKHL